MHVTSTHVPITLCIWTGRYSRTNAHVEVGAAHARTNSFRTHVGREIRGHSRHWDCNMAELPSHFPPPFSLLPIPPFPLLSPPGAFFPDPPNSFLLFLFFLLSPIPLFLFLLVSHLHLYLLHASSSCFLPLSPIPPCLLPLFSPFLVPLPLPSFLLLLLSFVIFSCSLFSLTPLSVLPLLHPTVTAVSGPSQRSQI